MILFALVIATISIINLALFLLRGHPTYWQTSIGVLGKLYSNTMMVVLNSRIIFQIQDNSITSNESSASNPRTPRRSIFRRSHGGISVTREQWTLPLDVYKTPASRTSKELEADSGNVHAAYEV